MSLLHIPPPQKDPSLSPLWHHFIDLRKRLIVCIVSFLVAFLISYTFSHSILSYLTHPLSSLLTRSRRFIYTSLSEAFLTYLKASAFVACVIASPLWALQVWRFIKPALPPKERLFYGMICASIPILFFMGSLLAYYGICPLAWKFFLSFEAYHGLSLPLEFEAKISDYINLTLKVMMVFGFGFQLPVVLSLLVIFQWVSLETLKKGRKYAFLLITIFSACVTPPDIVSPLGLMVPLYGLYELTLLAFRHQSTH